MKKRNVSILLTMVLTAAALGACGQVTTAGGDTGASVSEVAVSYDVDSETALAKGDTQQAGSIRQETAAEEDDLFTERDLEQDPDLDGAETITLKDGQDITIGQAGVYVVSGTASDVTIRIEAQDDDKVQLVLRDAVITNTSAPCIYVKNADKVFVTTAEGDSALTVSGTFEADEDTNTDAVIFSKDDLVLNGTGTLTISSSDNGIAGKDDIKITGSTLRITCAGSAIEAHDEIAVADGTIEITGCHDGLHAENDDDDTQGSVTIAGGTLTVQAEDDAIHATTVITIDGGELNLTAAEAIEATVIRINDGTVVIKASDDGINAKSGSSAFTPLYEQNGGSITIEMGAGDTDGVDSNGDITINGGTISITGQSTFDCDGTATYNGGTIIENGKETNTITNQMFGGPGQMKERPMMGEPPMGGPRGQMGQRGEKPLENESGSTESRKTPKSGSAGSGATDDEPIL